MPSDAARPSSVFILYTICNYYSTIVYHITPSIPYHSVSEYIMPIQYHTMPHYPIPVHSIPHHTQITPKRTVHIATTFHPIQLTLHHADIRIYPTIQNTTTSMAAPHHAYYTMHTSKSNYIIPRELFTELLIKPSERTF